MKKKILFVSMNPFFGGGETYLLNLAELLSGAFELHYLIASRHLGSRLAPIADSVGYLPAVSYPGYSLNVPLALAAVRRRKIDIAHLNGVREIQLAHFLRLRTPLRVLTTRHTDLHPEHSAVNRFKNRAYVWTAGSLDRLICVSHSSLVKLQKRKLKNLVCIPNWAPSRFREAPRPPRVGHPLRLLVVARLEVLKGHLLLFEACRGLSQVRIDIVGYGPDESLFRNASRGLDVHFHGFQEDPLPFYREADFVVLPSFTEGGNPMCLLEGFAAGVPCLAADLPSIREVVHEGANGILFRRGDALDLRRKIVSLTRVPFEFRPVESPSCADRYLEVFH